MHNINTHANQNSRGAPNAFKFFFFMISKRLFSAKCFIKIKKEIDNKACTFQENCKIFISFCEYSTFGAISNNTHDYTLSVRMQSVCALDSSQCFK